MPDPTGITEESPGVRSSKRVSGITAMALGGVLLVAVGVVAMFRQTPMPNAQLAIDAGRSLAVIGAALLGITTLEHFAK